MDEPCSHPYRFLARMAEDMQSGGLIDSLERFQMFELAHAAHFAFLDESNNLMMRDYKRYGVLEGRYIYTETGQTLTLVEQSRQINGVRFQRLTDEDQYRALIDASAVALDQGDLKFYVSLWERHSYSIFIRCLHCLDGFAVRDDCTHCDGRGFIEDPQCRTSFPGQ
ncbi:Uncharacterized protein ALO57_00109 [Pseudomonas coronafaciens pv. oryzae]|nr:hypothetical protein [Pseudomonas coronafaciens]KPY06333.1 Uncharacterized protein ALO57_00109 [Pseudomonas coronafaciens pv. oryzae]